MFSFFKKKEPEPETVIIEKVEDISGFDSQINWMKEQKWISDDFDNNKKNILIMDDRHEIISSMIDDLRSLSESVIFNLDYYNIVSVSTKMAGFHVLDILEKAPDVEIHFALLDIILGGKREVEGRRRMVDGVDVALKIYEQYPNAEILFFSGCIIENSNDPSHFKNKFNKATSEDIRDHIMAKDISFKEQLQKLSTFFNGF